MEDYHRTLTQDEEKFDLLLLCVKEDRKLYRDCKKKKTLKNQF